ncbi:MAG TPA: histidine phosphatase family protein [Patescibacteria group bacterium]|nr:histidine phosphatase family protein [Patescibacteria group bacterium]
MSLAANEVIKYVEVQEASRTKFKEAAVSEKKVRTKIVDLGSQLFANLRWEFRGKITEEAVGKTHELLSRSIEEIAPPVWAVLHEHVLMAPTLGRAFADEINSKKKGKGIRFDKNALVAALELHEIGSVANSSSYFHKDYVGEWIQKKSGVPEKILTIIQSMEELMRLGKVMNFSEKQLAFKEKLSMDQEAVVKTYVRSLSLEQMVFILSDNLSKRGSDGQLFTVQGFRQYLETQEERYKPAPEPLVKLQGLTSWPSTTFTGRKEGSTSAMYRRSGAVLQLCAVELIIERLQNEFGLKYETIRQELNGKGSKIVVLVRHEKVNNPDNIVYNLDNNSRVMHLEPQAKERLEKLATTLKLRKFVPAIFINSPQTRAVETAQILQQILGVAQLETDERLSDARSPGPYETGLPLDVFREQGPDIFDADAWAGYNHEKRGEVEHRMNASLDDIIDKLKPGQIGMLVSHGTPLELLLHNLTGKEAGMPETGSATVVVFDAKGEVFTHYRIRE